MKRKISLMLVLAMLLGMLAGCSGSTYKEASSLYDSGNFREAAVKFEAIRDYQDSAERASDSYYRYAEQLMQSGDYAEAISIYEKISGYKDADQKLGIAEKNQMYVDYPHIFDSLFNDAFFYEDTSVNAVNVISFTMESATLKQIYYDGNGPHTTAAVECAYTMDTDAIVVYLADGSTLELNYSLYGTGISLGAGYFSTSQVMEAMNGYWGIKRSDYNSVTGFTSGEYIYQFSNGHVTFESASSAYGYTDGTYYYYGPYEGTYTITANGMEVDARNNWQFGFVISGGQVVPCRCGELLTPYSGFKGQGGFSF